MAANNGEPTAPPESNLKVLQVVYNPASGDFQVAGNATVNLVMSFGMLELAKHKLQESHHKAAASSIVAPGRDLPVDFRG